MNNIQEHKDYVTSQLEKAFGAEIEKAHKVGDQHPNGKWVWTEYKPGKFDWRPPKKNGVEQKKTEQEGVEEPNLKQNKTDEPMIGGKPLSEHAAAASTEALKRVVGLPNVNKDLKAAAQKELDNRGEKSGESADNEGKDVNEHKDDVKSEDDFTDEDSKRLEELTSYIDNAEVKYDDKWYDVLQEHRVLKERSLNHGLKKEGFLNLDDFKDIKGINTIHLYTTNDNRGKEIQKPYISIKLDKKKDVKNFINDVNKTLGIELSEDDFEFSPRNRYSDAYYEIAVNPETKEFSTKNQIEKQIREERSKKQSETKEAEKLAKRKSTMNELKDSKSLTREQVEKLLDDDDVKGHAFSYFNYGDDDDCSEEEKEQFEKLEKLGAKVSDYFDWKESDEAESYERKMQAKGYRLFDISTSDGSLWLMIKNDKLSKK